MWSVLVPVVAILAGILFATSGSVAQGRSLRSDAAGLPDIIREQTQDNTRMTEELEGLSAEVDELTLGGAPGNAEVEQLTKEGDALGFAAGRTDVEGPGVEVQLTDSKLPVDKLPEGFSVDDIVVHQQDVQAVVNALWAGGAEAMMIQDQRIISTSAVRCVGNTLILQGRVYSPPYRIRAIGDPASMREMLTQSPEVLIYQEYVRAVGLGYEVRSSDRFEFPAYAGSITPDYATVDDDR
ncbi:membrane protein [Knoellia flava]|uniref:Membrane protein n=1 Tax=Knoellia flava TaxID=913969 RepID=A0A8H9FX15_9MICO|nr:membrane protein [Knoellia flava]